VKRARSWLVLILTAAICMMVPGTPLRADPCPGRFWRNECWYRVYFRSCPGPWKYYGSYNDCQKAEQVVHYLQFEGVEAYYQGI
jgi:hypothetical protein